MKYKYLTDKKAINIFEEMIMRGLLPKDGTFEITDILIKSSYEIYRELYPPKDGYVMSKGEIKFSNKLAGLNFIKLNKDRIESVTDVKEVKRKSYVLDKSGFVYVLSNKSFPNMFKVGITQDMTKRLSQYQTADPYRSFKIEHYIFVQNRREKEKEILDKFSIDICEGEWISNEKVKNIFTHFSIM